MSNEAKGLVGGVNALPENGISDKVSEITNEGKQTVKPVPPAMFGFDEEGTFHLQIHSKTGFLQMIGFLYKAITWMNNMHEQAEKKAKEEKEILMKPKGMLGKFNIFK